MNDVPHTLQVFCTCMFFDMALLAQCNQFRWFYQKVLKHQVNNEFPPRISLQMMHLDLKLTTLGDALFAVALLACVLIAFERGKSLPTTQPALPQCLPHLASWRCWQAARLLHLGLWRVQLRVESPDFSGYLRECCHGKSPSVRVSHAISTTLGTCPLPIQRSRSTRAGIP